MSKAGAHRAQGDPRLTHRGSTEPLLETGAARLLLRDVKRMTILPMVTSSLLLWPRRRLPVILLPVADVRLFCGRPFLPCGKQRGSWARCRCVGDVGNGPVGLALGSLQVGLRPSTSWSSPCHIRLGRRRVAAPHVGRFALSDRANHRRSLDADHRVDDCAHG